MSIFSELSYSSTKDTIIMFIANTPQTNFEIWGILLPYYFSYLKHFNDDITFNQVFASSCFFYLGILLCSWVYPSLVTVLGLKNMIRLSGTIYSLNTVIMHSFSSLTMVCLTITLIGFCIKIMFVTNMLYFSSKYPKKSTKLIGLANIGYAALSFIWAYLYFYFINPGNDIMTEVAYNGTIEEKYFKWEIAQNFKHALNMNGLTCFIITMVCSMLITNPERYDSNIYMFLAWLFGKDKKEWVKVLNRKKNKTGVKVAQPKHKTYSTALIDSRDSGKSIELLSHHERETLKSKTVSEIVQEELKKKKFWILFLVSIIKFILVYYMIDMNKIFGLIILKNDKFVTKCYSVISISIGVFYSLVVLIFDKIGYINGYIITSVVALLIEIYFMSFTEEFPLMFILSLFLSLLNLASIEQINNLILIYFYSLEVTLELKKIFDFNLFIANVIIILCNTFLFKQTNFFPIFFCFFIFDVIGLLLAVVYLRSMKSENNKA